MDFTKLVKPLSEYYGSKAIEDAIKILKTWYEDEAYDEDDVVQDWNPEEFEDSEGIDKLVELLKYPELLNNNQQKRILYSHCCYHLLPDQAVPTQQLIKHVMAEEEPMEKLHGQFQRKLVEMLHIPQNDAQHIVESFAEHVEEQDYDIEAIEDDLNEIDESEIIGNLIEKFPKLENRQKKIFDILLSVITTKDLTQIDDISSLTLKMSSTEEDIKEAEELSKKYLKDIFHSKDSENVDEKSFIISKSWDISNHYPWLSNLADTYIRFVLESHKRICEQTKDAETLDKVMTNDIFISMTPKVWFEQHDPLTRRLKKQDATNADFLCNGIMTLFNRLTPRMNINYKMDFTIVDSYDAYAKYAIAINEFIYTISSSSILQCSPIQFDFLIIPRCVSISMYQDDAIVHDDLWKHTPSFLSAEKATTKKPPKPNPTFFGTGDSSGTGNTESKSYDDDDDDDDDDDGVENETKMNSQKKDPGKPIWNFEAEYLKPSGYVKGKDYFGPINVNVNDTKRGVVKILNEDLWRQVKDGDRIRYKRYIIIIDRRNPQDLKNRRMSVGSDHNIINKTIYNDRAYLICPKIWGQICKQYQYKLNEIFMQNLKEFLLPIPNGNYKINFGGLMSGNGYKFVLSYQIHSQDKVKVYWYLNSGYQRFFIHDIEWLWYRFFVKHQNGEFQKLSQTTQKALQRAKVQHQLLDKQFIRYRQGYKLLN